MAFEHLLLQRDGAVARVTINRPQVHNALNRDTLDELCDLAGLTAAERRELRRAREADRFHDECGVFGVHGHPEAAHITYLGLYALQHRGQESAGIAASVRQPMAMPSSGWRCLRGPNSA